ncbi:MAG: acylphosphatase [Candidatus Aureabacteria bacterium]|nr:acylphosphatase [Candidatus Auribacterota bacterium]
MQENPSPSLIQANVKVRGIVQGVCFRYFVLEKARNLQVTGWVRNCTDGTVEAVIQGTQMDVDAMLDHIQKGPPMAQVENMDISRGKPVPLLRTFEIRR